MCLHGGQVASGYITASGRETDDANWYVIDRSTVQGLSLPLKAILVWC